MLIPQAEGGIQITDAESVGLCPWVEFYPGVIDRHEVGELFVTAASVVQSINELGIRNLTADFARIESRSGGELIALKFGSDDVNEWTQNTVLRILGVDVSKVLDIGEQLDRIVDFQHNGEVVIYREERNLDFHIDHGKKRPIGVRRCLLSLDGDKTSLFKHPETEQVISSLTVPGSAVTISYGAIKHAVRRDEPTWSVYIQS